MDELSDLYRDSVFLQHADGVDLHGRPQLSPPAAAAARVVRKTRTLFFPATGKTLTTSAAIYFRDAVVLSLNDRITLPGESVPRVLLLIEQTPDDLGRTYTKVWIQ